MKPQLNPTFLESAMKVPPNTPALRGEKTATLDVLPPNGGKSPLPPATFERELAAAPEKDKAAGEPPALRRRQPLSPETLLHLWTLYAETHMAGGFGGLSDAHAAQGVRAGIVATLLAVLPEEQFREVIIRWDVDAITLTQLLHVAGVWAVPDVNRAACGPLAAE